MNINKERSRQIGGKKEIPMYVQPINTPYHSNDQKAIYKSKFEPYQQPTLQFGDKDIGNFAPPRPSYSKTDQPILDLKLYPEAKGKSIAAAKQASIPIEPIALTTPFFPPQFQTQLSNFMKNFYTPFIYKDYHINIGGPEGDHIQASMIYEDALPPANIFSSYKSLNERNNLNKHIRSTFIQIDEGENINFGSGENSLLSILKLIELNPYNTNRFSNNPYNGLPKDMFIFNSCYPIIFDKGGATTQCNRNSTGINLRIYRLKIEEAILVNHTIKKNLLFDNTIYEFKKNETIRGILEILQDETKDKSTKQKDILKLVDNELNKIDGKDGIDEKYDFLNSFEYGSHMLEKEAERIYSLFDTQINKELQKIVSVKNFNIWREVEYYKYIREFICKDLTSPNFVQAYCYFVDNDSKINFNRNGKVDLMKDLTEIYSKKALVLLTESPNYNLFTWCSDTYQKEYNVKTQVYRGFKDDNEWSSIIAQMLISFYVMDKYEFTIIDMQLNNNFYIKDIGFTRESIQYWKYTINFIDYYIPNYGSLLLVDSDYREIDPKISEFKIKSKIFDDDVKVIKQIIRTNARNCLNVSNFGPDFKNIGGVAPSEKIKKLIDSIQKDLTDNTITFEQIIKNNLINYIHNRVGTILRESELKYIVKNDIRPFKMGELVIYESKYQTYNIVLYMGNKDETTCNVLTKEVSNDKLIQQEYQKDLLYHYASSENIKQDIKAGEPALNFDYIIENYVI